MLGMNSARGIGRTITARHPGGKRRGSGTWTPAPAFWPILGKGGRKLTAAQLAVRRLRQH